MIIHHFFSAKSHLEHSICRKIFWGSAPYQARQGQLLGVVIFGKLCGTASAKKAKICGKVR